MIAYLLYSSLCSGLLLLVYRLLLEMENMHRFKRFYLLLAIIFSYAVPFLVVEQTILPNIAAERLDWTENVGTDVIRDADLKGWWPIAIFMFWAVSVSLFARLTYNLYRFTLKVNTAKKRNFKDAVLVLDRENQVPYSFLRYIVVGKAIFDDVGTEKEILHHELAHVKQGHSYDLLFIEIFRCLQWCNPFLYLYKRSIQLNHEFLADESVNRSFNNIASYQSLLLTKVSSNRTTGITSRFNFGMTRKRLVMMGKSTSRVTMWYKQLIVLPFMLLSMCLFGQRLSVPEGITKSREANRNETAAEKALKKSAHLPKIKNTRDKPKRSPVPLKPMNSRLAPLNELSRLSTTVPEVRK